MTYQEDDSLDKMRKEIQESVIESKREQLKDEYGMVIDHVSPDLSPQAHNEWLDYILEWERQFAGAKRITVRERIGDPPITPVEEIPADALGEALDGLLEMLFEQNIVVDFWGEWGDDAAYRYITEELLDEEMDDIQIEGTCVHFDTATLEYEVQMWVEEFVWDVFGQEREYFLPGLKKQPLFDENGARVAFADFATKLEAIWAQLPEMEHVEVIPSKIEVAGATATVEASIAWAAEPEPQQIDSFFKLQPSPYGGWDIVYTSLLEDLLALLNT